MHKYITIALISICIATNAQGQVVVKWSELIKNWGINSAGYPSDEPALDSLYYKLKDFNLLLKSDSTYKMNFSKESIETGRFSVDKKKREITFTATKTGKKLAYSVAELTPDMLLLIIAERYNWAYYISLTPHQ